MASAGDWSRLASVLAASALSVVACSSDPAPAPRAPSAVTTVDPSSSPRAATLAAASEPPAPVTRDPTVVELPGAGAGIGFDDLRFAPHARRLLVPAGRTGRLDLVDPVTRAVTPIEGFTTRAEHTGGHDFGVTSADEGPRAIYATDRTSQTLYVIDPTARLVTATVPLAATPDYVRYVAKTHELWITEPDAEQIEVLSTAPVPRPLGVIAVKGGPESLVVDEAGGAAYTNLWKGRTVRLDLRRRRIRDTWTNGCIGARGLDLDVGHGLVLVACEEGKLVALDRKRGERVASVSIGDGVDAVAYDAAHKLAYVPGGGAGTMAIVEVGPRSLRVVEKPAIPDGSHCVALDGAGHVYVCDPAAGRLRVFAAR